MERGQAFPRSDKTPEGLWTGVAHSLQNACRHAGSDGLVATMPELIAIKVATATPATAANGQTGYDRSHWSWQNWYSALTEEDIGPNYNKKFYPRAKHLLVVVHGGGILTPESIFKAYEEGLVNHSARYPEERGEFRDLLDGKLPDGSTIPLFPYEEVQGGAAVPRRCGIVMPYQVAQKTKSDYHTKRAFLRNPLVIARNAGMGNLDAYFDRAENGQGSVGNWHPFSGRDASVAQGRLLFLGSYLDGLNGGSDLGNDGRFVGVAPEARRPAR